ncbi:MAG: penicillin-binding protein 2 [bacterium]|nr:penicillin-binding protein 2 [bacterium]
MTDRVDLESPQLRKRLASRVNRLNGATQLVLFLIAVSYWYVQIAEGAIYRELADNNRLRKLSIEATRGRIYDRHGRLLVENVPSYYLLFDRSLSRDLEASLDFAAAILEPSRRELADRVAGFRSVPSFHPVRLAEKLTLRQVARFRVEQLEHPEFEIAVEHLRLYRHAHRTGHLLGYLGEVTDADLARPGPPYRPGDLVGKKGIEGIYEEHLRGWSGEQVVVVNSRGRRIEEYRRRPARPGRDLRLTLDLDLQLAAARLLDDKVGAIVALDPRRGEVLAMVSSPSFDPNRFARRLRREQWQALLHQPNDPLQNRTLHNAHAPGSVFKIVMALAGLDLGLIEATDPRIRCRGSVVLFDQRRRCWARAGHGRVDLELAIRRSCDVYFYQLGQKLDIDQIAGYARIFGLGKRTGIDLGGERSGLIPGTRWSLEARGTAWYPGETISIAIGQGPILTTPLQVAVLMSAIATGRRPVKPRLVLDSPPEPTPPALPFRAEHLEAVRRALWSVVNDPRGTGRSARVEGLEVAGKTGTVQVITQETWIKSEDLAPELRDHAWFASYAPAADPRLVVVVFVEHGGAGSTAAAPLARTLYEQYFRTELAQRSAGGGRRR